MSKNVEFKIVVDSKQAQNATKRIENSFEDIEVQVDRTDNEIKGMDKGFSKMGVAASAAGAAVGAAMVAMARRAHKVGAEFESMVDELSAITGIAGDDLDTLGNRALEMSAKFGTSASDVVEAQKLVASQLAEKIDFSTEEGIGQLNKVTEQAITLQKAAGIDLKTAVEATSGAINQFGFQADEAARVVNVLAAGSKFGAAEVREQAEAFEEAGPAAANAGQSIEETNAGIQVLAANAIKGSKAGTGLRNMFTILESESDKLAKLGLNDVNLKADGFAQTLEKLQPLIGDTEAIVELFGREAASTASILIRNADAVESLEGKMTGTQTASEQARVQMDNYNSAVSRLTSTIDAKLIASFNSLAPLLTDIVDWTTELISGTKDLTDEAEEFKSTMDTLNNSASNLVDEYQRISEKTNKTEGDKRRLKEIAEELSGTLDTETIRWNGLGEAIGVNTEKARENIKVMKRRLRLENADQLKDQIEITQMYSDQLDVIQEKMNRGLLTRSEGKQEVETLKTKIHDTLLNIEALGGSVENTEAKFSSWFGLIDSSVNLREIAERVEYINEETGEKPESKDSTDTETDTETETTETQTETTRVNRKVSTDVEYEPVSDELKEKIKKQSEDEWQEVMDSGDELEALAPLKFVFEGEVEGMFQVLDSIRSVHEQRRVLQEKLTNATTGEERKRTQAMIQQTKIREQELRTGLTRQEQITKEKQDQITKIMTTGMVQATEAVGMALGQMATSADNAGKALLMSLLDILESMVPVLVAQITAISLAEPQSVATFFTAGFAKAAILTGILKGVIAGARGAVEKMEDGGYVEAEKKQNGGLLQGNSHSQGGIPAVVKSTQRPIEMEGDEFVTNRKSTKEALPILEQINKSPRMARTIMNIVSNRMVNTEQFSTGGKVSNFDSKESNTFNNLNTFVNTLKGGTNEARGLKMEMGGLITSDERDSEFVSSFSGSESSGSEGELVSINEESMSSVSSQMSMSDTNKNETLVDVQSQLSNDSVREISSAVRESILDGLGKANIEAPVNLQRMSNDIKKQSRINERIGV